MQKLRIRELRLAAGLDQSTLGKAVGVAQPTVSNWEAGRKTPQTSLLPAIAKALGCTVNDLFAADAAG